MYLIFIIIYNFFRVLVLKLRHGKNAKISWLQRIAVRARIQMHSHSKCQIAKNLDIRPFCEILVLKGASFSLGYHSCLNRYCMISCHNSIEIGENCMLAPGVKIFDNNHCFDAETGVKQELKTAPIKIGNNCWLASNVVVTKGTTIGDNCVIGAGCVVSGNIPSGSIVKSTSKFVIEKIK